MKTAKEMFEELGYEQFNNNTIYNEKMLLFENEKNDSYVYFYYNSKGYEIFKNKCDTDVLICSKLHLAVHQQMKELGWIE